VSKVLNVGQCGLDHWTISRQLRKAFGAEVVKADTHAGALESLRASKFDLVLVNRVTDRDGSPGLDLIRALKADPALASVPVMLVSNYPDAQQAAEALGGLPGFGKAEVASEKAVNRLKAALGG